MSKITVSKIKELICANDFETVKLGAAFMLEYPFKRYSDYFKEEAKFILSLSEFPGEYTMLGLNFLLERYILEEEL